MKIELEYPHYKGAYLGRVERIERFVIDELIRSSLSDDDRESSQSWELMHSSTCKAFMHVLAEKRGLPSDLARVAGVLHDYYVIKTGKYKDHARLGAPLVEKILHDDGGFSDMEIQIISDMAANHSDKHLYCGDKNIELIKDVDVFDCSLYFGTEFYYLTRKPLPVCQSYFERILKVRGELGMPLPISYLSLDLTSIERITPLSKPVHTSDLGKPTVNMLLLWSLLSSNEAKDWQVSALHYHNGAIEWYIPSITDKSSSSVDQLGWSDINRLWSDIDVWIDNGVTLLRNKSIKQGINYLRTQMQALWVCTSESLAIREEVAISLRDYNCDHDIDDVMNGILEQIILENAPNIESIIEPPKLIDNERDLPDEDKLIRLAKLYALELMRTNVADRLHNTLLDITDGSGNSIAWKFPVQEFGLEPVPQIEDGINEWLLVGWPRFDKFELNIGERAGKRLETLTSYFNNKIIK